MSTSETNPMILREVLYRLPGMDEVIVERDRRYSASDGLELEFDLYRPPATASGALLPAVVLVGGFPGLGVRRVLDCGIKELGAAVSWCRLLAASGIAAVAYENRKPAEDLRALLATLRRESAALGLDPERIGLWATSGNAPLALGALVESASAARAAEVLACAVLAYPYTLDLEGASSVAEACTNWGFVNGGEGKSIDDLPAETPVLVVRAGRDAFAGLNDALDRFVGAALRRNLPFTLINHASGGHAFELEHDDPASRRVVEQILGFLQTHLLAPRAE